MADSVSKGAEKIVEKEENAGSFRLALESLVLLKVTKTRNCGIKHFSVLRMTTPSSMAAPDLNTIPNNCVGENSL